MATPGPGSVTPDSVTPGSVTPDSVTPGSVTPDSVTPGSVTPGSVTPEAPARRPPLAAKALSEPYVGLRYRDASFLIWSQQQLQATPPHSYLSRSQHAWYSNHGNQPVLVPERAARPQTESRICALQ